MYWVLKDEEILQVEMLRRVLHGGHSMDKARRLKITGLLGSKKIAMTGAQSMFRLVVEGEDGNGGRGQPECVLED